MFAFITNVRAKPGRREELMALTTTMQQTSAAEDGVPVYVFHAAEDDPDELWFYDLYVTEAAYNEHCATPAFKNMIANIAELGEIKLMHKLVPYGLVKGAGL